MKRRGRPPKSEAAQEQTQAPELMTAIDLNRVKAIVLDMRNQILIGRTECDFGGHDLAGKVGYLERCVEDLIDALGINEN